MICIDCGTEYEGQYCPNCGQPANTHRITPKDTLHSVFTAFLVGDNKFLNTCLQLVLRPGIIVRDYLYGRRAKLMAPVPMLVRLVAVFLLLKLLLGIPTAEVIFIDESIESNIHSESLLVFCNLVGRVLSNSVLFSLASASLFVLPYYLLFRGKRIARPEGDEARLNTAEHFCVLVYVGCMNMMLSFVMLPFQGAGFLWIRNLANLFQLMFPVIMYHQLYNVGWLQSLWRTLVTWIMVITFIVIVVLLVFGLFYGFDAVK